jgi:hypothetical protein
MPCQAVSSNEAACLVGPGVALSSALRLMKGMHGNDRRILTHQSLDLSFISGALSILTLRIG